MSLRPDLIKSALVAYIKASSAVLAELPDDEEIREVQWQGKDFSYPNIRVRISSLVPNQSNCETYQMEANVYVFSEEASSYQADRIAGIINDVLRGKSFSQSSTGSEVVSVQFGIWTSRIIPAVRRDNRTWQSELILTGTVS